MTELRSRHFACVYKLVFPNGKVYIGKSKDIGKRISVYERKVSGAWAEGRNTAVDVAMMEFGIESIDIEPMFIVTYVYGEDKDRDLDYALGIVEMRWIKEFDSSNPDRGYNSTEGGEMFGVKELVREKIVEKPRIVYKDVVVERKKQTSGVPVVGYDINGDYIGEWPSRVAFTREVINANGTLGYGVWRKGYIMYEKVEPVAEHVESYAEYIQRTRAAEIEAKRLLEVQVGKPKILRDIRIVRGVVFVKPNMEEEARYDSIRDAANESGITYSCIYACLKKGYGSTHGYYVFWSDDWDRDNGRCVKLMAENKINFNFAKTNSKNVSKHGKVYQYDARFNEIGVYESVSDASKKTGEKQMSIYQAARKGGNSFGGCYHWRFEADRIVKEEETPSVVERNQETLFSDDDF